MKFGRQDNERVKHFADVTIDFATVLCRGLCPGNNGYAYYCSDCEVRRIFIAAYIAKSNAEDEIRRIDREEGVAK